MTDMNKIIKLRSLSDNRIMTHAAINGTTCTDFNVIFQDYPTTAFHPLIPQLAVLFRVIIKRTGSDDSACLDNDIIANYTMIKNGHIWINDTVRTDRYMIADVCIWKYNRAFSDYCCIIHRFGSRLKRAKMPHNLLICFKWLLRN